MIRSVLVANRGEIARRVFRTCRTLGLGTVAVFSDPDTGAPHAAEADAAVRLPGAAPNDTYLRVELIVDAAKRAGADAIHPGYGFLSENAAFARAVLEAGLTWIGPPPDAIDAMGSKIEAKRLMADANVPVLRELDPAHVTAEDLPVLIKASAGGGGRGMRVVRDLAELPHELDAARAEAASAFGDPTVFCEPYLATGRHIEVQVMADRHGTVWAVGERECSIQRRHQKVIEEAPSPLVDRVDGMRKELFEAARAAAKAIGYTGAGTVEFLADDEGRFFFLEMNTRLQVEHPVTECTTGLDLVALQIAVADGTRLDPESPAARGHAIEARLYAEDPAAGWQPQSGRLSRFDVAGVDVEFGLGTAAAGVRLDSGVVDGTLVGIHYDPMLAKVIAWAPTRTQAATALAAALARARIHGVVTNRDLLVNVLRHEAFLRGETDTAFFDRHGLADLATSLAKPADVRLSALAGAIALDSADNSARRVLRGVPSGWRNVVSQPQRIAFDGHEIAYRITRDGLHADGFAGVTLVSAAPDRVVLDVEGVRRTFEVTIDGDEVYVDSALGPATLHRMPRFVDPAEQVAAGSLLAPMPGSVVRIAVELGQHVTAGEPILWLEAMKMQHRINAPADGVITELPVREGQQIDVGAVLAVVSSEEE
jgi:propionyl-CoA carboxylase alpha chain